MGNLGQEVLRKESEWLIRRRLRARLLQVLVKDGGEWKIAAYHNVDVKAGVFVPEPQ